MTALAGALDAVLVAVGIGMFVLAALVYKIVDWLMGRGDRGNR